MFYAASRHECPVETSSHAGTHLAEALIMSSPVTRARQHGGSARPMGLKVRRSTAKSGTHCGLGFTATGSSTRRSGMKGGMRCEPQFAPLPQYPPQIRHARRHIDCKIAVWETEQNAWVEMRPRGSDAESQNDTEHHAQRDDRRSIVHGSHDVLEATRRVRWAV